MRPYTTTILETSLYMAAQGDGPEYHSLLSHRTMLQVVSYMEDTFDPVWKGAVRLSMYDQQSGRWLGKLELTRGQVLELACTLINFFGEQRTPAEFTSDPPGTDVPASD